MGWNLWEVVASGVWKGEPPGSGKNFPPSLPLRPIHSLYASHPSRCIGDPWQIVEVPTFDFVISLSLPLPPSCPLFHESTTIDGSLRVVAGFHPHPLTSPRALSVGQRGGPGGKAFIVECWLVSVFITGPRGSVETHPRGCGKVGLPSFRTFDESRREHR